MTQNSSNSSEVGKGNTKLSPQDSPCKRWCFTFNNYTESEYENIVQLLNSSKYIIGKEVGENGTPHLQGYVNFETKTRLTALKKINNKIHWEKCKGSEEDNIKYCSKDGKYTTNFKIKKPLKILSDDKLYNWQKKVIEIIKEEPDDRKIYWFWEEKGCAGKTTFCKYLTSKYGAVPIEGKKNDILYCAAEFESDIYVMDIERSMEDYVSYGAIEKIKNGYYMCAKYESKPIVRNSPHVLIFANFEPDVSALSKDRWIITEL
nr:rep protein [Cressdnaviricota sp.]